MRDESSWFAFGTAIGFVFGVCSLFFAIRLMFQLAREREEARQKKILQASAWDDERKQD